MNMDYICENDVIFDVRQANALFDFAVRLRGAHMIFACEQKGLTVNCRNLADVFENRAFALVEKIFLEVESRMKALDPEEAKKLRAPAPHEYASVQAEVEAAAAQIKRQNGGVFPETAFDGGPVS